MSQFFFTNMGGRLVNDTLPALVREVTRLNNLMERHLAHLDAAVAREEQEKTNAKR